MSKAKKAGPSRLAGRSLATNDHSAFFDEIRIRAARGSVWQNVAAGLVILRLVDAWMGLEDLKNWGQSAARRLVRDPVLNKAHRIALQRILTPITAKERPRFSECAYVLFR